MHLFIYSLALYGFSVVAASTATLFCNTQAFHHCGFSCGAQGLGTQASGVAADSVVVAYGLSCSHSIWNLPKPGIKPVSPALAGRFLASGPQGKSTCVIFNQVNLRHPVPFPQLIGSLSSMWRFIYKDIHDNISGQKLWHGAQTGRQGEVGVRGTSQDIFSKDPQASICGSSLQTLSPTGLTCLLFCGFLLLLSLLMS